jgi:AcrR family transcriptional regulator
MTKQNTARKAFLPTPVSHDIQSLRNQHKELTRNRLVSAAMELFAEFGYRATSVGDIAKAAGTTPTTFYRYFNGKSDLARLLQDQVNTEVGKTLRRLDEVKRPTRQAIREWIDQYGSMWHRMHFLCDAYWEATSTDPKLAAEVVPVTYKLTDSMKMMSTFGGSEPRGKFQTRLVLMYLLMDRLLYLVNIQGHNATATRMLDEFSEIFRAALFSDK